jgi:hypothetical protein
MECAPPAPSSTPHTTPFHPLPGLHQPRYNLLREEGEGYAKLLVRLVQAGRGPGGPAAAAAQRQELQALLGYCDLDPNRVLDVVLGVWEQQADVAGVYEGLLQSLSSQALLPMLGARLAHHQVGCRLVGQGALAGAGACCYGMVDTQPALQPP